MDALTNYVNLPGKTRPSLVFKIEGMVLCQGMVPTITFAEQKDFKLQKTKLGFPWLKMKEHIGTAMAKRAMFQWPSLQDR